MHPTARWLIPLTVACAPQAAQAAEYTLLIYEAPSEFARRADSGPAGQRYWQDYATYGDAMKQAGILRGGAALHGERDARTTTGAGGDIAVVKGAHAASAHTLGGYFVVDVDTLDSALAWAARAPAARLGGAVEVRPNVAAPMMR